MLLLQAQLDEPQGVSTTSGVGCNVNIDYFSSNDQVTTEIVYECIASVVKKCKKRSS